MSAITTIFVKRMADKEVLNVMRLIANDVGAKQNESTVSLQIRGISNEKDIKAQGWDGSTQFDEVITEFSEHLSAIAIYGNRVHNNRYYVKWSRNTDEPFYDKIEHGSEGGSALSIAHASVFMLAIERHLRGVTTNTPNFRTLGPEIETHFKLREQRIEQQERQLDSFFGKLQDFTLDQTITYQKRLEELAVQFERRKAELDQQHESKNQSLLAREEELAKKLLEFDIKESKGHRRALQKTMKGEMAITTVGLEVSPRARALRRHVGIGLALVCLLSGGLAAHQLSYPVVGADGRYDYILLEIVSKPILPRFSELVLMAGPRSRPCHGRPSDR